MKIGLIVHSQPGEAGETAIRAALGPLADHFDYSCWSRPHTDRDGALGLILLASPGPYAEAHARGLLGDDLAERFEFVQLAPASLGLPPMQEQGHD